MDQKETTLEGTVERVVYTSAETGYAVVRFKVKNHLGLITAVGSLHTVNPGETVRIRGQWVSDPRYGRQFKVESYLSLVPATLEGIEKYLGSGMIRGIGPVFGRRLVDQFGADTLDIIENHPEKITEVEGIGPVRAQEITRAWDDQKRIRDIMIFLQGHGVSSTYAIKIYKQYQDRAIAMVKENPYRLAADIHGIGFRKADQIAQNLGIDPNSRIRAEAGVLHILNELVEDGHCYFPREALMEKAREILKIEGRILDQALEELAVSQQIVIENGSEPAVFPRYVAIAERGVAEKLIRLVSQPGLLSRVASDRIIRSMEQGTSALRLSGGQKDAILKSLTRRVLVITGGPGTGKTTIIKNIVQIYRAQHTKILLAAPTGRAAKRLSEATAFEAKTIHRLLEYSPRNGRFERNEEHPLPAGLLVIDEASMVDIILMHSVLLALPPGGALILVGDVDQLPSVGPGTVLRDIIGSGRVEVVHLTEIFRQAQKSQIVVNAHRVNRGDFPHLKPSGESDFFFIEREEPERALETIKHLCCERIPQGFNLHPVDDVQLLSPMHKGLLGVSNLNREFQMLLNPQGEWLQRSEGSFRIGDKVMQIRNNYDREVFNGDIGKIVSVNPKDQEIIVRFEDRPVVYPFCDLDELTLAYAISVHKSQGSEYAAVIVPILTQHFIMLQRNLLYTAITRAKRLVILVGTKKALSIAIKNDQIQRRYCRLRECLAQQEDTGRLL